MQINVNYEEVYQQAQYLQNKANEYEQIMNTLNSRMHEMQSIWQGADNLAFVSKFDEFYPKLNQMKEIIREYALYLKKSASMYEQLQQDRIAQARLLG